MEKRNQRHEKKGGKLKLKKVPPSWKRWEASWTKNFVPLISSPHCKCTTLKNSLRQESLYHSSFSELIISIKQHFPGNSSFREFLINFAIIDVILNRTEPYQTPWCVHASIKFSSDQHRATEPFFKINAPTPKDLARVGVRCAFPWKPRFIMRMVYNETLYDTFAFCRQNIYILKCKSDTGFSRNTKQR